MLQLWVSDLWLAASRACWNWSKRSKIVAKWSKRKSLKIKYARDKGASWRKETIYIPVFLRILLEVQSSEATIERKQRLDYSFINAGTCQQKVPRLDFAQADASKDWQCPERCDQCNTFISKLLLPLPWPVRNCSAQCKTAQLQNQRHTTHLSKVENTTVPKFASTSHVRMSWASLCPFVHEESASMSCFHYTVEQPPSCGKPHGRPLGMAWIPPRIPPPPISTLLEVIGDGVLLVS